jgi:tetratricopeptide (TPR) repeat protein
VNSGVLGAAQRRMYRGILLVLGALVANSAYLVGARRISSFYMGMLLGHLALGGLLAGGLALFVGLHLRRVGATRNRRARRAGVAIVIAALVCLATGVFLAWKGATLDRGAIYAAHLASVPAALLAFVLHRRAHTHRLALGRLLAWAGAVALGLAALLGLQALERPAPRTLVAGDTRFAPSSAETHDQGLLDPGPLSDSAYCGECHQDTYERWSRSAHRFSSFNNPFYRRSIEEMTEKTGRDRAKWCAGCHDPVVLFSGKMGEAARDHFRFSDPEGQQGLTCLACHGISEVKDVRGNAAYVIEQSRQYPFAFAKNPLLRRINHLLIRMEPSLHRQTFLKPFHREPAFCSTCHKVALTPELNGYRWLRGQDHFDSWQDSGVSGQAVRSFYDPPAPRDCRGCHLPLIPSSEPGSRHGQQHDHLFPAANTALPALRGDAATVARIQEFLRTTATVDVFALTVNDQQIPIEAAAVQPGDEVEVHVVTRTRGVGHAFTNGTADSNEVWLAFRATLGDRLLQESGALDARGQLDLAADRLGALLIAHDGSPMTRRQPQDIHTPLYNNNIGPGAARVTRYRFRIPPESAPGTIALDARLLYRKFTRDYARFTFGEGAPALPVTEMARGQASLAVGRSARGGEAFPLMLAGGLAEPWQRWNDHGIGLLLQGDLRAAERSFERVERLAPGRLDGPLNLARVHLQGGDHARAARALDEAGRRAPGSAKIAFFRATLALEEGRLDQTLADLDRVLRDFPRDRSVHGLRGRALFLLDRHEEALAAHDQVLAIDPDDLGAHYGRMLSLRALGRHREAGVSEAFYLSHKEDESGVWMCLV